jgi:hypothetical protein
MAWQREDKRLSRGITVTFAASAANRSQEKIVMTAVDTTILWMQALQDRNCLLTLGGCLLNPT